MSRLSNDLFYKACKEGDLDSVKHCITAEKHDVNAKNKFGYSPFYTSCQLGRLSIVQFLLTIPECEVNFKCPLTDNTPLHIASRMGHEAIVQELLNLKTCDVNCKNKEGDTALHIAVRKLCGVLVIEKLISHPECDPHISNKKGETATMIILNATVQDLLLFPVIKLLVHKIYSSNCSRFLRKQVIEQALALDERLYNDSDQLIQKCFHFTIEDDGEIYIRFLHDAVHNNWIPIIEYLLKTDGETTFQTFSQAITSELHHNPDDGLLQIAVKYEHNQVIRTLLGAIEKYGIGSLLHLACAYDHHDMLKCLLDCSNFNPSDTIKDQNGDTPLHLAVRARNSKCVAILLTCASYDINIANNEGDTPLHIACQQGSIEIIDLLFSSEKLDLHAVNAQGEMPLHVVFRINNIPLALKLLEESCDPRHLNREQIFKEAIKIARENGLGSLLYLACTYGSTAVTEFYLSIGCTVEVRNEPDLNGDTLLHIAAKRNMSAIVKMLLTSHGSDPNVRNSARETPLHMAVQSDSSECVEILLASAFCDPNIVNSEGDTPLHIACQQGSIEIIDLLLGSEKIDFCITNAEGKLPVHVINLETIAKSGHYSLNELQDGEGNTVLHMAVQTKASACVATLLTSASCDLDRRNIEGDTPLHIACEQGSVRIIDLLLSSEKVDLCSTNTQGKTPLHILFQKGRVYIQLILKLLEKACSPTYLKREQMLQEVIDLAQRYGISSLLLLACIYGSIGVVELLLGSSYCTVETVNKPDINGNTPLHIATRVNMSAVVKMLLTCHDVDPNAKNIGGVTALIAACNNDDCFECAQILATFQGCDPNEQDDSGSTALHIAVQHNTCELISILLSRISCDPNVSNLEGDTPLHLAVRSKSSKCVELLLASTSCDPNIRNCVGDTPVHIASRMGHVEIVQLVTKTPQCNPNILNHRGEAPLHIAIESDLSFSTIFKLLKIIGNPNTLNPEGETALYIACKLKKICIIEMLLKLDQCDPNISTHQGMTPLHIAIGGTDAHTKIVKLLLAYTESKSLCDPNISNLDGNTPLHLAVQSDSSECVEILLASAFCDPNVADSKNNTPLHIASQQGSVQSINLLLRSEKIDLHAVNAQGGTPLHIAFQAKKFQLIVKLLEKSLNLRHLNREQIFEDALDLAEEHGSLLRLACIYGSTEIVEFLLGSFYCTVEAVNEPDKNGDTPLHIAAYKNMSAIVEIFLACDGVNPNVKNAEKETALLTACKNDCFECAKILASFQGCDPNEQDGSGNTALHVAVHHNNWELVNIFLCNSSCEPNVSNLEGDTLLHLAVRTKNNPFVETLLADAFCDPSVENNEGDTPLHIACQQGSVEIVDLLLSCEKIDLRTVNAQGMTPLHTVCQNKRFEIVVKFLEKSCNFRYLNTEQIFTQSNLVGDTPLHLAVRAKSSTIVETLLGSAFCDSNVVNSVNSAGDAPLHIACQESFVEIIDLLLRSEKLDLHTANAQGNTPLHIVFQNKNFPSVVKFLEKSCNLQNLNTEQIFTEAINLAPEYGIASLLHLACMYNSSTLVNFFVGSSHCTIEAVNEPDVNGNTPLHFAATTTYYESEIVNYSAVLIILLSCQGIHANAKNVAGETALIAACIYDCFECVQILATFQGCDPNEQDNSGSTALHVAVQHNSWELVNVLFSNSSCDPNISNLEGDAPLHLAVQTKSSKCVEALLTSTSCDPNILNSDGDTPLHIACQQGSIEVIDILFSSEKLDMYVTNCQDKIPLHVVLQMKNIPLIIKLLEENCNPRYLNREQIFREANSLAQEYGVGSLVHLACLHGGSEIVNLFLGNTYCTVEAVNEPDVNGDSPLHMAAKTNRSAIVEMLLAYPGVDPNAVNMNGITALIAACNNECFECAQIFVKSKGCDLNMQNRTDGSALHVAVQHNNCQLISILLSNSSCDPNISNLQSDTPLHSAVRTMSSKCVAALLASTSCDPSVVNSKGDTPLHIACQQGSIEIIDLLFGAEKLHMCILNAQDKTPLHIAFEINNLPLIVKLLENYCLKYQNTKQTLQEVINLAQRYGIGSLLLLACSYGSIGVVELLLGSSYCTVETVNKPDINGNTPLHIATRVNMSAVVKMLLTCHDVDPNAKNAGGVTALNAACNNDDCFECAQILATFQGCDPNEQDDSGSTALHVAVQHNNCELISILLSRISCDPNISNLDGDTPLHLAVRSKSSKCVELLLASTSCDPNILNGDVDTPLHIACQQGSIEIIDLLLGSEKIDFYLTNAEGKFPVHVINLETFEHFTKSGHYSLNEQDGEGNTVLHMAVQTKASACVATLLTSASCDLDIKNIEGDTPLHIACEQGSVGIVDLLLSSQKVDLCSTNTQGKTPLHIVFQKEHVQLILKLLEKACSPTYLKREQMLREVIDLAQRYGIGSLLLLACSYGSIGVVELLLGSSYCTVETVNKPDMNGNTPLHIAIRVNMSAVVKMLLTCHDIDPNAKNAGGVTALIAACNNDYFECAQILATFHGCDPNEQDDSGSTALHVAVQHNNCELISILLSRISCDPNVSNLDGDTPLHLAVHSKSSKCVELLLASTSCDPNIRNCAGDTPLHIASRMGHVEIVQLVTKTSQCNPNILNHRGEAPLHIAIQSDLSFSTIADLLLQTKMTCNPNIVNAEGETPLYIACKLRKINIVEMLLSNQCNPNISTHQGLKPLHIAIGGTDVHTKIIKLLLANTETDPHPFHPQASTPLLIAFEQRYFNGVQCLLEKSTSLHYPDREQVINNAVKITSGNLLLAVCSWGNTTIAENLFDSDWYRSGSARVQNTRGDTLLHVSVINNKPAMVRLLAKCDMNIDVKNKKGETPLRAAYRLNNITCVRILADYSSGGVDKHGNTILHMVVTTANLNMLKALLCGKACDPNECNGQGETPLHVACRERNLECVKLLASDKRCDVDKQNKTGDTALHIAIQEEQFDIAMYLIQDICCNPAVANAYGNTPLHLACNKGAWKEHSNILIIVRLLLSIGKACDPNECNAQGETPLHVACRERNLECVKLLASDKRCDVDKQNKTGDTALHIAIQEEQFDIAMYLIQDIYCNPAVANADGNTPLHLACNKGAWKESEHSNILMIVRLLLSTGKVDPECVNNAGIPSVELPLGNYQIMKELSSFVETKLKHPIQSYIKLFFMGNAYAGKSTLVQAICTEASKLRKLAPSSQYKQVTGVEPLTAGIVPLSFHSRHFGNAILYDFAGQHEYYSSHAAVLENLVLSSPPVFLLVFNLSEPTDHIREELAYWWSFIDSHCKKTSVTPHVILIGSHKDVVKSRRENVKEIMQRIIQSMREIPATFHIAGHVSLDCRSLVSNGLSELLTLLKNACKKLRESVDVNIDLRCHILYAFLTDKFQHRVACTASEVQATIETDNTILPQNPIDLEKVLSTLNDMGHILFLRKSSQSFKDSWIVLQRQALLTEVNGSIFAPENFRQHIKDLAQVTGIVPLSRIKQRFQNSFNSRTSELVIVYSLTHLEFCFKIEDYHTLDILASDSKVQEIIQEDEEYYFFPALVQIETPTDVWKPNPQMTFQCGWFYECIHPYQFLTTRFLHVLILRLAFSFALAVDHTSSQECPVIRRRCSMWKHGIAWWNDDGIETIVEVGLQRHWVVVIMRCAEDQEVECVQHRTAVIKSILDTTDEFCPSILMSESLISPSSIQYPYRKGGENALYSLKEVATTLIKGKPYVTHDTYDPIQLTELLPFEPYIGLSKEVLEKLFNDEYLEKQVTDPDLTEIAEKSYHNLLLFKAVVKPNPLTWQRWCEQAGSNEVLLCVYLLQVLRDRGSKMFKELQTQLSKFSIFCGRNPLDVAEGRCSAVQDATHNSNSAHTVPPSSPPSVSSTDSPQVDADIQPSSSATTLGSSLLQQSTIEVHSIPLAPLVPSSSPSLLVTNSTHVPADLDMQLQPNSAATTVKISLLQQLTGYGEVDNTHLGTQRGETQKPLQSSVAASATLHRGVNPTLSTEPTTVVVSYGKETQQYQTLFSNFPTLVDALSSMVSAEGLADKLYFSAGLITKDIWEDACVGGVANSRKLRLLMNSILSQVELNATNYGKFVAVLKEFDELQDIIQLLETV